MKQYCRWCVYLITVNGIWCDKKEKCICESTAKSINHCKDFEYVPIDAFSLNEHGYRTRQIKEKECDGQLELIELRNGK